MDEKKIPADLAELAKKASDLKSKKKELEALEKTIRHSVSEKLDTPMDNLRDAVQVCKTLEISFKNRRYSQKIHEEQIKVLINLEDSSLPPVAVEVLIGGAMVVNLSSVLIFDTGYDRDIFKWVADNVFEIKDFLEDTYKQFKEYIKEVITEEDEKVEKRYKMLEPHIVLKRLKEGSSSEISKIEGI